MGECVYLSVYRGTDDREEQGKMIEIKPRHMCYRWLKYDTIDVSFMKRG